MITNSSFNPQGVLRYPFKRGRNYYSLFPLLAGTREILAKSNPAGLGSLKRPSMFHFNTFDKVCNQNFKQFVGGL